MAIGESQPMRDSIERVTGRTPFALNMKLPGMLSARVLRSQIPHGRLLNIDTRRAEALNGVVAVLAGKDLGTAYIPNPYYGLMVKDQPIVALERVRFIGEPLAAVAAENASIAEEALGLIKVEIEEIRGVFSAVEALQAEAPCLHDEFPDNCFVHARLRHGELSAGFAASDEILEEIFTSPAAQQASLEPHVSLAQWGPDGLTVWSATQAPYMVRRVLAEIFNIAPENVRVIVPPIGGGYGGKGHTRLEPLVSALARKAGGRPVKLVLSREEEFVTVTKHAARIAIKTGFKRDGKLTARQVTLHWNAGAYADVSPALVRAGMVRSVGPYRIPAVHVDSYGIYTNLPSAGAFRGAMSSQTTWAYESHMDSIAHRLGIDPVKLRGRNLLQDGDAFATGEIMNDVHFDECLRTAVNGIRLAARQPPNPTEEHIRRGFGAAVMMKSSTINSKSECRLELNERSELTLFTSTVEMGQGSHTALAQIAAEGMKIQTDQVRVVGPDTALSPFDSTTSASRSSGMMGGAIQQAAALLMERLTETASMVFECQPVLITVENGRVSSSENPQRVFRYGEILKYAGIESLSAVGVHEFHGSLDPETGQGQSSPHWHQGAGACEIEVDTETGKLRVLRYYGTSYAGRVINPMLARLQNEGNIIFGLGPALVEEILFDAGQVVNANLSDYLIPSILDMPDNLQSFSLETPGGEIHGIGEMTLPPVAPAIANALYDAVGVRIYDLPITAEKILRELQREPS